jgi:flagellar basal body-associated protein FliL
MAAKPDATAEKEPESPEKPKTPLMQSNIVRGLLGVALVIVILGVVFLATYYFTQHFRGADPGTEPGPGGRSDQLTEAPLASDMEKFTVIIFDESGRSYNLRIHVFLTVNKRRPDAAKVTGELVERKLQLTDAIYDVLIGMDPKNFMGSPQQRIEGMAELKATIIRSVNSRMKHKIDGCYFKEFIFQ